MSDNLANLATSDHFIAGESFWPAYNEGSYLKFNLFKRLNKHDVLEISHMIDCCVECDKGANILEH